MTSFLCLAMKVMYDILFPFVQIIVQTLLQSRYEPILDELADALPAEDEFVRTAECRSFMDSHAMVPPQDDDDDDKDSGEEGAIEARVRRFQKAVDRAVALFDRCKPREDVAVDAASPSLKDDGRHQWRHIKELELANFVEHFALWLGKGKMENVLPLLRRFAEEDSAQ